MIIWVSDFVSIAITYAVFGKVMAINKRTKRHSKSDASAHNVGIEGVGYGMAELLTEGVCIELLNVHYRGEILAREPTFAFAAVGFANVAGVASRSIAPCAIVNEQTVGVERLRERYVDELAVGSKRHTDG